MNQTRQLFAIGILLGLVGAVGQIWFVRSTAVYAPLARGILFIGMAALIGLFAVFSEKKHRMKAAAFGGFIVGFVESWSIALFSLDRHAFQSAEAGFSRVSAIVIILILTSWMTAGLASLVAFPITQVLSEKE